jgi:hypothetical protein
MSDHHPAIASGEPADASHAAHGCSVRVITIERRLADTLDGTPVWTPLRRIVLAPPPRPTRPDGPLEDGPGRHLDVSRLTLEERERLRALLAKVLGDPGESAWEAAGEPSAEAGLESARDGFAAPARTFQLPPLATWDVVARALVRNRLRAVVEGEGGGGAPTSRVPAAGAPSPPPPPPS